jgi:hypothetical protein
MDESPHVNADEADEGVQDIDPAFDDNLDSDVDNITIEEDDCIFMMMVHPVDPYHFVHASSMVSGCLAEAFAKNLKPKDFHDIVPTSLHAYANIFTHYAYTDVFICIHRYLQRNHLRLSPRAPQMGPCH